jgi:hypothetical protein
MPSRKAFLPTHVVLGLTIYAGTVASILSGATDRQWIGTPNDTTGPFFVYGGLIAASVLLVVFVVMSVRARPKRDDLDGESAPLFRNDY